jgi:hypothetical protein
MAMLRRQLIHQSMIQLSQSLSIVDGLRWQELLCLSLDRRTIADRFSEFTKEPNFGQKIERHFRQCQ